jgi:SAM-dependent MidA family methyltransferase
MSVREDFLSESNPELVTIIREEIERVGPIRFDRFMDLALYHPEHGYYRVAQPAPGRAGDFITAPEAHPVFGATLAAQIVDFDELLDHPDDFWIVEYGAGSGMLIRPVLAEIRQKHPEFYSRITYCPIELNHARRAELEQHLTNGDHAERLALNPPNKGTTGCLLANEFLDAFPVRRITRRDGALHEEMVDWQDGWFAGVTVQTEDPDVIEYISRHQLDLEDGDWIEYHPGIETWVGDAARMLARGFSLVIDYGYPAEELFTGHRRGGTLKAYYRHGVSSEIFRGIGRQDLTAHVNFSEIEWHALRQGLSVAGLTTQAELLANLGIGERLVSLQQNPDLTADDYLAVRAAVLRMIDPGAMGRFRALILKKNVADSRTPAGLTGSEC